LEAFVAYLAGRVRITYPEVRAELAKLKGFEHLAE